MSAPRRPRFSRWRRLPGVFRTGEHRPTDSGTDLDRIILYIPAPSSISPRHSPRRRACRRYKITVLCY